MAIRLDNPNGEIESFSEKETLPPKQVLLAFQKRCDRISVLALCQSPKKDSILTALKNVCSKEFKFNIKDMKIPHDKIGSAQKIKEVISTVELKNILKKSFFDIH